MAQFNAGQANTIGQANQAAQQAKINSDIQASYGLTNTGQSMNAANAANYNMLTSAGASQSMHAQNQINAQMAKFNQAFNYPQQQLGVLEGSLGMTPHDTSSSGQSSTSTTTPTDWASLIKGGGDAASSVLGMMGVGSDKSMKTDVTKLGKDPKTGLQMHAYRYKGDPKSYPKVVGPMAQEVQEKYPDKAKRIGGKLTVDPSMMAAAGVQGFAAGTPFVGPSLAAFTPPSSPGVAKGIGALSAFRPPTRLPRGLGVPRMQKFAGGTDDVQALDDNAFDTGGDNLWSKIAQGASKVGGDLSKGDSKGAAPDAPPAMQPGQPSMGYLVSGYAAGVPRVPGYGTGDTVPAMLTPGEAVLNRHAAQLGRGNIAALNARAPMGIAGALANLKRRPKITGGLSGALKRRLSAAQGLSRFRAGAAILCCACCQRFHACCRAWHPRQCNAQSGGGSRGVYLDPPTDAGHPNWGTGDAAVGAIQWEGKRQSGVSPTLQSQVDKIWDEFNNPGLAGMPQGAFKRLQSAQSPGEAAHLVNTIYQRPLAPAASDAQRQRFANVSFGAPSAAPPSGTTTLTSTPGVVTPPHTLTPPTAGAPYTPAAVAAANPPPAPAQPQNAGDWFKKLITRPEPTKDAQGNDVQGKSPLERLTGAIPGKPAGQQGQPAAPDAPTFAPVQDPMGQMAGPAGQLLTASQPGGGDASSWSSMPYGSNAGQRMPGMTLNTTGYPYGAG